ncbi:hypothetical protein G7K71_02710 [Desulfofundulus sp. TPOSR]|uniref:hypothetical protein n=1 Tax=Desulfofundulus sp. TPOSR TaxID=2714340 RepID=UPI001407274E|nr:hypothetical protein [Desulfofundulus sp. TPOSR]NHM25937.1 hypothetical protein [Desulfofundulus sp. TPOSR]
MQVNEFLTGEMSRGMSERNVAAISMIHVACQYAETREVTPAEEYFIRDLIPMIEQEDLTSEQVARLLVMGLVEIGQKALDADDMDEFLLVLSDIIAVAAYLKVTGRVDPGFLGELYDMIAGTVALLAAYTQPDSFIN